MKYLLFVLVFVLTACTDYDYKISTMPCKELTYSELPVKVKECLSKYPSDSIFYENEMMLVDNNDGNRYQCEAVHPVLGSKAWIDYMKIIDSQKNIVYRIETETPSPYIIYSGKLYIPSKYNILLGSSYDEVEYSEYELK